MLKVKRLAIGELVENLSPLMSRIMNETLLDYHEHVPQNHSTVQAQHDIKILFEKRVQSFIFSKK